MEHLSHSLSKKSYRDNDYAGKMKTTVYDDVFGGPPRFGGAPTISPRLEDYTEIFESFHASRGSSIPILHLPPEAADDDLFLDVRSSKFDYSEVFGGFDAADFGVSYEELLGGGSHGCGKSSDDEWTPAQSGSLSDESDPSASPERNPSMTDGDLDQSYARMSQLKVTHNEPSTKTEEDMSNSKTHVTHFHAVPGGKVILSRKIKDDQIPVLGSSDLHPSTDFGGLVTEEKRLRKTMSQPSEFGRGRYGTDLNLLSGREKPCSDGTRPLLSVSDINLKTQPSQLPPPSRPPPALTSNIKDSDRTNSRLKPSKSYAYERRGGDTSPTYFDVEIDASSSAAVSAEAVRDAMEKAQAKLRSAKESRERKKDGLSNRLKLFDNDSNDKEARVSKNCDRSNSFENERMLGECEGEGSRLRYHTSDGRHKLKKRTLVIPGSIEGQKGVPVSENSVQSKHGKERKPSHGLCRSEETSALREETQFYEMLGDNNVRDANIFEQTTRSSERGQNSKSVEAFELQEDNRSINVSTEACGWEEKQNQSEVSNGACQWNGSKERLMMPQKYHWQEHQEKVNLTRKACELKERGKKLSQQQIGKILKEAYESEDCENLIEIQLKENNVEFEQKPMGTIGKLDTEKRLKNGFEKEEDQMGSAQNLDWEYFVGLEDAVEQAEDKKRVKKSVKQDAKERQQKEASERENEKKQEDHGRGESKRGVEQHHGLEENEKRLKRGFELEQIEKRSSMVLQEENKQTLVSEVQVNEKMLEETRMQEENQNKCKEALALKENARKQKNACERVKNEKIVDDGWNEVENERMHKKAFNSEESRKASLKGLTADKSTNEALKEEVTEKKLEACNGEENEIMVQGADDMDRLWEQNKDHEQVEREEKKRRKNVNEEIFVCTEVKNLKELHGAYASNGIEILQSSRVGELDRDGDKFETTQEASPCEQDGLVKTDTRDCEKEVEAVDGSEELIEKAKRKTEDIMSHDTAARSNDDSIAIEKSVNENDDRAPEVVSKLENANILVHSQVEGGKNMKGAQCSIDQEISKGNFTWPLSHEGGDGLEAGSNNVDALPAVEGKRITINTAPKTTNQNMKMKGGNHKETFAPAEKEKDEKLRRERELENEGLRKIEEREKEKGDKLRKERELENDRLRKIEEERKKERDEKLRKERELESDCRRKMEEEREKEIEKDEKLRMERVLESERLKKIEEVRAKEKEEKLRKERELESDRRRKMEEREKEKEKEKDEKLRTERALESERLKKIEEVRAKEKEEKLKKERELESDRLRKMEEERERQREREKDLMAVDKATLEAREKAFFEARERAERAAVDRAAAEVRQIALAEARERLEKACAEARERTFAGKTSMEARLRAERAAVEKAAAEARERAVEKGAAEKAAFDARERDERSVADKLSSSSRSSGIKQNPSSSDLPDSHFRSLGSYSGSRYGHSSAYGGGESESPQRCKARLERHQRTAERAAKALAEKNMRDHLAQREQAERNRLAEGLDAEVKRWSSGKEGNLRALLSTLQYILGSDSGWQPVPLTDVITTAAVKKAYRKATLCVHPDKLQQRGASIHQKYICEKVFDLLKEAWSKFNSEER